MFCIKVDGTMYDLAQKEFPFEDVMLGTNLPCILGRVFSLLIKGMGEAGPWVGEEAAPVATIHMEVSSWAD